MTTRKSLLIVLLAHVAIGIGCSKGDPNQLPTFPATGKVEVDGKAVAGVILQLVPDADNPLVSTRLRPGATSDQEGKFSFGTYMTGDGAPEGHYKLIAFWPPSDDGPTSGHKPTGSDSSDGPPDVFGGKYFDPTDSQWAIEVTGIGLDVGIIKLKTGK